VIEVTIPAVPLLGPTGQTVRPAVLLYGAEGGSWQRRAVHGLRRAAAQVIRTDVETFPRATLHPTTQWSLLVSYFEVVDVVACWCGNDQDSLYLSEWTYLGWAVGGHLGKLVLGIPQQPSHPMASGLRFLANAQGLGEHTTLEGVIAATVERCRQLRGG
jgi:hypothetical protein